MLSYNITALRKDIYTIADRTLEDDETVLITTKNGNLVLMSQDDFDGIMETLYLMGDPDFKKDVEEGHNAPLSDFEAWN